MALAAQAVSVPRVHTRVAGQVGQGPREEATGREGTVGGCLQQGVSHWASRN